MKANRAVTSRLTFGVIAALLVASIGSVGCSSGAGSVSAEDSSSSAAEEAVIEQIQVPVEVTSPAADEQVAFSGTIALEEGANVLTALESTGLAVDAQDGEYGMFVNAVDGLTNEGMMGWTYTVNGEQVQTSADKTILNDGDRVEWSYIDMSA